MSEVLKLSDILKNLTTTGAASGLISTDAFGNLSKVAHRVLVDYVFATVSNTEDLDNPTTKGVYTVNKETPITRPTQGRGWDYGFVINLAIVTGVQFWINFDGYLAIRGKGTAGGNWVGWFVFAPMAA